MANDQKDESSSSRRDFLIASASIVAAQVLSHSTIARAACSSSHSGIGSLSGKTLCLPDVNAAPMPSIAAPGIIHNGKAAENFEIQPKPGLPDVRSYRKKFGLLIPATNTSMEHELWSIIFKNPGADGLDGVGLHTANISTPKPQLQTKADLIAYRKQFLDGLTGAIKQVLLAQPEYLIMGMSLEHIIRGVDEIRKVTAAVEAESGLSWSTWHDAAPAALKKFGAKRIGILTPFDKTGNENAIQMFSDLGFEVISSVGFSCANALHIAHIPDSIKERAILELLATKENRLDAVVQCGTNMSLSQVSEKLEPKIGIPILGINAVTFWYALRENNIQSRLVGSSRLLREF